MTWHSKREFDSLADGAVKVGQSALPVRGIWSWLNTLRHTLRFRLMLWNAVVVGLTTVVVLVGLRAGVRYALLREVDSLLKEDLQEIALSIPDV